MNLTPAAAGIEGSAGAGHSDILFPKVIQQIRPPATGALRVMHDLLQLGASDLAFVRIRFLINEPAVFNPVARTKQEQTFTRQTVPSRTPCFLVVTLNVLWQIV